MIPAILGALGNASAGLGAAGVAEGASFAASAGQAANAMERLTPSLRTFTGIITALPNQLLQAKAAITSTFGTLVQTLAAPVEAINELGNSISRFTRLSNPAQFELFTYKVENAFAAVGKILSPILDALGRAADKANEALNKAGPAFEPLVGAVVDVTDAVANGLVPAMRELAPLIRIGALHTQLYANAFKGLMAFNEFLASQIGIGRLFGGFDEDGKKSVAARTPRLSRSMEDIQREAARASILASQAEKKKDPQLTVLEQIRNFLTETFSKQGLVNFAAAIGLAIRNNLPDVPGRAGIDPKHEQDWAIRELR